MPWDFVLILAFMAVVIPWRGAARVHRLLMQPAVGASERLLLYGGTVALQWIAAVIVLWRSLVRDYSPTELGLAMPDLPKAIAVGLTLAVLFTINQVSSVRRLASSAVERERLMTKLASRLMPRSNEEVVAFIALVATVAFCEEFLYRGFAQSVLEKAVGGSVVAGILLSSIVFALGHIYQGKRGLLVTFLVGIVFAGARVWTGGLVASVIAHFATDLSAGLSARRWLPSDGQSPPALVGSVQDNEAK
jgi:uncharacterized protein